MSNVKFENSDFIKSSSCHCDCCIEVAQKYGRVAIRDSKQPTKEMRFSPEEWNAFLVGAKNGEFDFE